MTAQSEAEKLLALGTHGNGPGQRLSGITSANGRCPNRIVVSGPLGHRLAHPSSCPICALTTDATP